MDTLFKMPSGLLEIIGLFLSGQNRRFYIREIERITKMPIGTVQRYIAKLESEGVLTSSKEGPLKYLILNESYPYLPELKSVVLRQRRRRELEQNLKKLLKSIKKDFKPDKVILYGSLVGGRVSPDGDIDIFIVKKDVPKRYWDRVREFAPILKNCDVGVDYVIWTPDELLNETTNNRFLREEILKKGKVIYDRAA